jgi:hypothetical protein
VPMDPDQRERAAAVGAGLDGQARLLRR